MAVIISAGIANGLADYVADAVESGSGPGYVEVRTGSQPAGPATAASGTLLVTFTLNDPAFGGAANGVITAVVSPAITAAAIADGTAGWFRIFNSAAVAEIDGNVTATGGGGNMTMSTTTVSTGLDITLTSLTITMPQS